MISVIIPTLWKAKEIEHMLPRLLEHKKVCEVIIIDNDEASRPKDLPVHQKLLFLAQETNIYVNPAWNLGVSTTKQKKICLMSDDILFDTRVFDVVDPMITEKIGVIGVNPRGIKSFFVNSPLVNTTPVKHQLDLWDGFGTLMFVHKKNYLDTPPELKIYWGDTWLYDYNAIRDRVNYTINDFCVGTKMRISSGGFPKEIDKENSVALQITRAMYDKYRLPDAETQTPLMTEIVFEMMNRWAREQSV